MQSILGNTRRTDITFHADGRIDISARLVKELSIRKGDVIDVLTDGLEYYLYVKLHAPVAGRHEAACFPTHSRSRHFRAWSKRLCQAMLPGGKDHASLPAGDPVTLPAGTAIPIICKHILKP